MAVLERGLGQRHIPERKGGINKIVAAGVLAGAVGLSAFGVYQANQNNNEPGSTPIPGGIIEPSNSTTPTPFLTENPTITIPPSPEVSPTPTPSVEPTPTPTPEATVPPIEQVKLKWPGKAEMLHWQYKPYFLFNADKATVVATEYNKEKNEFWFAVTIAGNKIKKTCEPPVFVETSKTPVEFCKFSGVTLWIKTDENTNIWDSSSRHPKVGTGTENIIPYVQVGNVVDGVGILFGKHPFLEQKPVYNKMNLNSFARLEASNGKKYPRSDRRFSFYSMALVLDTPIY